MDPRSTPLSHPSFWEKIGTCCHSPERHQPLTDRRLGRGLGRGPRSSRIADDAEAAVAGDGLWAEHPDDHDDDGWSMPKTVYMGAAGMVWGLHALGRDHPQLIRGPACQLPARARLARGVCPATGRRGRHPAGRSSCWSRIRRRPMLLEAAIRGNAGNETNELMWGAPGTMLAALAMHGGRRRSAGPTPGARAPTSFGRAGCRTRKRRAILDAAAVRQHRSLRRSRPRLRRQRALAVAGTRLLDGEQRGRAGAAGGRRSSTALAVREQRAGQLAAARSAPARAHRTASAPSGATARRAWSARWPRSPPDDDGFTALLTAGRRADLAGRSAAPTARVSATAPPETASPSWRCISAPATSAGCSGRAPFAVHALEQVERERAEHGRGRHSLWTGDIGAAVMAQSCIDARPGMPTLDWV